MPLPLYFCCFHSSESPLFVSTVSLFLLHFSCVGHLGFAASVCSAVSALFFHTLCCHSFSLQLLCAPNIFCLPPSLSSFHSYFHTPCPVAISCILFPLPPFPSFIFNVSLVLSHLDGLYTQWHTHKLLTYYAIVLIPQNHFPFNCSYGKDVCICHVKRHETTPQMWHTSTTVSWLIS